MEPFVGVPSDLQSQQQPSANCSPQHPEAKHHTAQHASHCQRLLVEGLPSIRPSMLGSSHTGHILLQRLHDEGQRLSLLRQMQPDTGRAKCETLTCRKRQFKFTGVSVCLRGATWSILACDYDVAGLYTSCTSRVLKCSRPQAAPGLYLPGEIGSMRGDPAHLQLLLCELEQVIQCLIVDLTVGGPAAQQEMVNMHLRKKCSAVKALRLLSSEQRHMA